MTNNVGYVLDTNSYSKEYRQILAELVNYSEIFDKAALQQIYTESWLQIFDCLDYDFIVYGNKLQKLPIFERFIGNDVLMYETDLCNWLRNAFKTLAVGFYYDLVKYHILEIGSVYVMTKLGEDYVVVCKLAAGDLDGTI